MRCRKIAASKGGRPKGGPVIAILVKFDEPLGLFIYAERERTGKTTKRMLSDMVEAQQALPARKRCY
jgi:hypothetical protein